MVLNLRAVALYNRCDPFLKSCMAQSKNSTVDFAQRASFHGLATYGDILIGNKAFEFYNQENPEDYIQIPGIR